MTLFQDQSREELCFSLSFVGTAIEAIGRQLKSETIHIDSAINQLHRLTEESEMIMDRIAVIDFNKER